MTAHPLRLRSEPSDQEWQALLVGLSRHDSRLSVETLTSRVAFDRARITFFEDDPGPNPENICPPMKRRRRRRARPSSVQASPVAYRRENGCAGAPWPTGRGRLALRKLGEQPTPEPRRPIPRWDLSNSHDRFAAALGPKRNILVCIFNSLEELWLGDLDSNQD